MPVRFKPSETTPGGSRVRFKPAGAAAPAVDDGEAKRRLDDDNFERAREAILGKPLGEQLTDPKGWRAAAREAAAAVPVLGPGVEKLADAGHWAKSKVLGEEPGEYPSERMQKMRDADKVKYPHMTQAGAAVGGVGGALALPTPGASAGARIMSQGAIGAGDAALRGDEDVFVRGVEGAAYGAAGELASPLFWNRTFAGIPEDVEKYYRANKAGVNASKGTGDVAERLAASGKALSRGASKASGEAIESLRGGTPVQVDDILSTLDAARDRIMATGAYGQAEQALMAKLDQLGYKVLQTSNGMKTLDPERAAYFLRTLRRETNAYAGGNPHLGHTPGDGLITGVARGASEEVDAALKTGNTDYAKRMEGVDKATRAIKPLTQTLKDPTTAGNFSRRLMRGRDPEGARLLREFDAATGQNFTKEIKDAHTKEFFDKSVTNGSRQVNAMSNVGGFIGGLWPGQSGERFGRAVGGWLGAGQDVYARKIGKKIIDLSDTMGGNVARLMHRAAAKGGPQGVMQMHRFLSERDAAYRAEIERLLNEEEQQQ